MNLTVLLLIAALDLAGVFFGIRMLLSCFKDKPNRTLFQKYKLAVIFQFVYQVTVLAINTVEAGRGFGDQFENEESPCSVISLLSISLIFSLICNAIAMAVIHYHPALVNSDRSLSPNQVMASSFAVGCVISAILSWFSCFCQDCTSYAVFKVFICLLSFALVSLVAWRTYKHIGDLEYTSPKASPTTGRLRLCCDKKGILYSVCYGVMVTILCLSLYRKLDETELDKKALYLFAVNFIVGIVFPVSFKDLIDSNFEEQTCKAIEQNI